MDRPVILRLPCYSKCSIYNGWHIFSNRLVATVEMAETLKKMGYEVDDSKADIQKAFICSTKNLVNIASKSAKIKVNSEIHELKDNLKIKYLEENKKLLLTDGNDIDNEDKE